MQIQDHTSRYHVIGLMSGSSLDGLDIAYCIFEKENAAWTFSIVYADCVEYDHEWAERLKNARELDGRSLWKLHTDYGHYLAACVNTFIDKNKLHGHVDLVSSHGHTVFHFPAEKFTAQIGDGAALAAKTGITVACDFRTADIALGGQGTPIVPIGDSLLFAEYDYLLNLGGIANLSVKTKNKILAFDICAANQVLNHYALQQGLDYDRDGMLAASGKINAALLSALSKLDYYKKSYPKSLDNGFSREKVIPLIDSFEISVEDKLHTYCEHVALQLAADISSIQQQEGIEKSENDRLLITGGGALNSFLMEKIQAHSSVAIHIPSIETIQYKEALVMALIGLLRLREEVNILATVTGAGRDSIGGALYHP